MRNGLNWATKILVKFSGVGNFFSFQSLLMGKKYNQGTGVSRLNLKIVNH